MHFKLLALIGAILLLSGCDDLPSTDSFLSLPTQKEQTKVACEGESCIGPVTSQMRISIGNGDALNLPKAQTHFNLSGTCNTGNYPNSEISWKVVKVPDNTTTLAVSNKDTAGYCDQGRFMLLVDVSKVSSLAPSETTLKVEISFVGLDSNKKATTPVKDNIVLNLL